MKIFISWSGDRSRIVAEALRGWLPLLMETVEPWMSAEDIDAGARWGTDVDRELEATEFGILCITRENQGSPWVMFEAGALAKTVESSHVCPYLIEMEPSDLIRGPLTRFQAKRATEKETWELVSTINKTRTEARKGEDQLRKVFDKWWPDLRDLFVGLPFEDKVIEGERSVDEMVAEVLEIARSLERRALATADESEGVIPYVVTSMTTGTFMGTPVDFVNWFDDLAKGGLDRTVMRRNIDIMVEHIKSHRFNYESRLLVTIDQHGEIGRIQTFDIRTGLARSVLGDPSQG